MKKHFVTFTLLIAIVFSACAYPKKAKSKKGGSRKSAVTSISMSRGACFGRCPSYTVTITPDGKARYEGRKFAPREGDFEKQYSPAQVAVLFREFAKYRLDTCQEEYFVNIADLPGLDFRVMLNGKEKYIRNAGFGPDYFVRLGELVDKTVKIDNTWRQISVD